MAKLDVMVVEDEAIVAKDIQHRLTRLGYGIAALASSGEEAVEQAAKTHPDLVLMDIRLKGKIDGIEAAESIRDRFDVPVVFLTAHADDDTLQRAKATEPSGYLLKPFEGRELQMAIEIAVQKSQSGRAFKEHLCATLRCLEDGIILVDTGGCVVLLNPLAEVLTGWESARAIGKPLPAVFRVIGLQTKNATPSFVIASLRKAGSRGASAPGTLVAVDGTTTSIEYRTAIPKDEDGIMTGMVVLFRETTQHRRATEKWRKDRDRLQAALRERTEKLSRVNGQMKKALARRDHVQRVLSHKHIALKEILQHIQREKQEIHDQVLANVDHLVMPIVRKLMRKGTSGERGYLKLLERNLNELTAPFGANINRQLSRLSPREIEICNVLKNGLTSKEIGSLLNISPSTVERHRNNIRQKIGIRNQKINITTYLQGHERSPSKKTV